MSQPDKVLIKWKLLSKWEGGVRVQGYLVYTLVQLMTSVRLSRKASGSYEITKLRLTHIRQLSKLHWFSLDACSNARDGP